MIDFTTECIKHNDFSLLENSLLPDGSSHLFVQADSEVIVYTQEDFSRLLKTISAEQKKGLFAVGYFAYDCATFLLYKPKISTSKPYAHFVFYQQHYLLNNIKTQQIIQQIAVAYGSDKSGAVIYDLSFDTGYEQYKHGFAQIQSHLLRGDTYQVNYTGRYNFKFQGCYFNLYQSLRKLQAVRYSAFLPFSTGHVLSFSPELFFTKKATHIHVRPMKGTALRTGDEQQDQDQINFLKNDLKNNAENLIIVDLLRNDLAAISDIGSVTATSLFDIEAYRTVYQMTSTIQADVSKDLSIKDILQAMFPCGSITGAPKISTMNIINQVEQSKRELYTGAIGYIAPNNNMSFSVAIRTLVFDQNNIGSLGVGGGITTRSDVADEWQEMHLKAKFFLDLSKPFQLIETLLYDGGYSFLDEHISRLTKSSKSLGFKLEVKQLMFELNKIKQNFDAGKYKIRVLLNDIGKLSVSYEEINLQQPQDLVCALARVKINQDNILYQHKTTAVETRGVYSYYFEQATNQGCHDVLFQNQLGNITETTRYNVFYQQNGQLYTPPISDGLLPGIYRQHLIDTQQVVEKSLAVTELNDIESLFLCNSVRGIFLVKHYGLVL